MYTFLLDGWCQKKGQPVEGLKALLVVVGNSASRSFASAVAAGGFRGAWVSAFAAFDFD